MSSRRRLLVASMLVLGIGCGKEDASADVPEASSDAAVAEASSDAAVTYAEGKLFMCGKCACDGRVAYCEKIGSGPPVPGQWDDAPSGPPCKLGADPSGFSCKPYATTCGAAPSCACIHSPVCSPTQALTACFARDGAVGFEIRCGGV